MKKVVWSGILAAAAVLAMSTPAYSQQTANGNVTVTANINAKAKLTISAGAITFADADPDTTPSIDASTGLDITVKARTTAAGSVTLVVTAADDLKSGTNTITIDKLTWASTGTNFAATGTSSKSGATVASFSGSGQTNGTQTYKLANSWAYATGTYSATLNYTLTAP